MTDRVPSKPGQYSAVIDQDTAANISTGQPFTITLTRDDQPVTEGTPLNKATLLDDTTAAAILPETADPTVNQALFALCNGSVTVYTHSKSGTNHEFTGQGANGRAIMTADVAAGDTFTVNGTPVTAYMGAESAVDMMAGSPYTGRWVTFVYDSEAATLNFKGGGGKKIEPATITLDTTQTSYTIPKGQHDGTGKVQIALEEKSVSTVPGSYSQAITPSSGKVLSKVTVNSSPCRVVRTQTSGSAQVNLTLPGTAGKAGKVIVCIGEYSYDASAASNCSVTAQTGKTMLYNTEIHSSSRFCAIEFTFGVSSSDIHVTHRPNSNPGTYVYTVATY